MRPFSVVILLLGAGSLVTGCSGDYKIATVAGDDDSVAERTADSAAASPDAAESAPSGGPSGGVPKPDGAWKPDAGPGPAADRPEKPAASPSSRAPGARRPTPGESSRSQPAVGTTTPSRPPSAEEAAVKLSAGVALPQSLPTGTAMGFSIDYRFRGGAPGSSPYLWVITPAKGQPAKQPVQLQVSGTLQAFFPQFRPENGPFRTHIEDAQGRPLCAPAMLKSY